MLGKIQNHYIGDTEEFNEIQEAVFKVICRELQINTIADVNQISQKILNEKNIDLRRNISLMLMIDNRIRKVLNKIDIKSDLIQFPVNVRILLPERNREYRKLMYNVDTLHCDHWSGAPIDSKNIYLYLKKEEDSPTLIHFEYDERDNNTVLNYNGAYKDAPRIRYRPIANKAEPGLMQIFDCTVPHMIRRNLSGATISVDLRLRNKSDVFERDIIERNKNEWISEKMTALGVYWENKYLDEVDIREKMNREIDEAKKYSEQYYNLRKEYLMSHYSYSESP